jgi:hypothetical protein
MVLTKVPKLAKIITIIWSVAKAVLSWKTNPARVDLTSSALTSLP